METFVLSKSTYLYGCQCTKRLWLNRFQPKLKDVMTAEQAEKFTKGIDFGKLAQSLFPGGVDVSPEKPWFYPQSAELTKTLLSKGHDTIYEATFIANGVMCAVDILVIKEGKAHVFEVKNALTVRPEHVNDAALQYCVMTAAGMEIADFSIIYRNKDFTVTTGQEPDISVLFVNASVTDALLPLQSQIKINIDIFKEVLGKNHPPDIEMGSQCEMPYPCNFRGYCGRTDSLICDRQ